ncbi:hypothetical protein UlMin_036596 [Ulmus minor]
MTYCVRDGHMHPMSSYFWAGGVTCDLCCNKIEYGSLFYGCSECGYVLHIPCGEFPLFINFSSHPLHPLKLSRLDNITSLMYSCNECSFYIHFACSKVPLPTISCDTQNHVQYICHNHPMTIVEHDSTYDGVIKHCFACESPWSSGPAYTCKNYCPNLLHKACTDFSHKIENYFLHPNHSLKLQVMKVLKGDLRNVKLIAVGDSRWKYNDTENGNERMPNEEVEGKSTLTLRHILQRLTEEERNELMNPFSEKTFSEGFYEKCVEKNSLVERKGHGEDISRLQNLLNVGWLDFFNSYMNEFRYIIPKDGLKLDEIDLKMKVVDVKGYQVPETLAPILKTMIQKKGDLGGKSSLTPEMRSIACTFVCILIDRMSTTKVEDITKDVLRDWFFYWQAIRKITDFDLDFLYFHLTKLIRVFLGSEAFKFQNEMVEKLQQRITDIPQQMAELQTELKSSKVNLEKLKSFGESSTSDFTRDNLRDYSKLKWKDACEGLF